MQTASAPTSAPRVDNHSVSRPAGMWIDAAAVGLVLTLSFVSFIKFHDYGYGRPEVLICFAALAAISLSLGWLASRRALANVLILAAVIIFFVDVQFLELDFMLFGRGEFTWLGVGFVLCALFLYPVRAHASRLVAVTSATALMATLLMPARVGQSQEAPAASNRSELPLVVHIVLDEHIGINGIPADFADATLAADIQAFYQSNGFRVLSAAYSEFYRTETSSPTSSTSPMAAFVPNSFNTVVLAPSAWNGTRISPR